MTFKEIPESRLTLERAMNMVREMGHTGNLYLTEGTENHGLDKVRALPNGRYDLLTINESARLIGNMAANREQMKDDKQNEKKN